MVGARNNSFFAPKVAFCILGAGHIAGEARTSTNRACNFSTSLYNTFRTMVEFQQNGHTPGIFCRLVPGDDLINARVSPRRQRRDPGLSIDQTSACLLPGSCNCRFLSGRLTNVTLGCGSMLPNPCNWHDNLARFCRRQTLHLTSFKNATVWAMIKRFWSIIETSIKNMQMNNCYLLVWDHLNTESCKTTIVAPKIYARDNSTTGDQNPNGPPSSSLRVHTKNED
jgi:hypothetical protein